MSDNRFLTPTWKIVGILALITMLAIGYFFIKERTSTKTVAKNTNIKGGVENRLNFAHTINIPNTPYSMLPLEERQNHDVSYYSKNTTDSVRNYIFVDTITSFNNWLLPTNKYVILNYYFVETTQNKEPKAIIYEIVKNDTNKDKYLSKKDTKTLAISYADGRDFRELIDGVDRYLGSKFVDEKLTIFYEKADEGYSLHVNLTELTATKEINLAKIKDKK